ncbi:MAG: hypothetical protein Q4D04_11875 [Clostridia bacterium]|nr:hypothetical protein [Clostridia bacterium]
MKSIAKIAVSLIVLSIMLMPVAYALSVYDVEYDHDDRTVEFEFDRRVRYKSTKVVITDTVTGKKVSSSIRKKDNDDIKVRVSKRLTQGRTYRYKITNVSLRSARNWQTLTGTFVAWDD